MEGWVGPPWIIQYAEHMMILSKFFIPSYEKHKKLVLIKKKISRMRIDPPIYAELKIYGYRNSFTKDFMSSKSSHISWLLSVCFAISVIIYFTVWRGIIFFLARISLNYIKIRNYGDENFLLIINILLTSFSSPSHCFCSRQKISNSFPWKFSCTHAKWQHKNLWEKKSPTN